MTIPSLAAARPDREAPPSAASPDAPPAHGPAVDLVYFNAGGGHRASALALKTILAEVAPDWRVRPVNLFEALDPRDRFRRLTGSAPEDWYNRRLARGWTLGMTQELKLLQRSIRVGHRFLVERMRRHWVQSRPDLVVSLVPNFNRAMFEALAAARPGIGYVTVLTDLADYPPSFWIETGQRQDFVCGTRKAVEQARALGHDDSRIHATSGMLLRPEFYRTPLQDRAQARIRLGLDPDLPTGIVLFGGHGSKAMQGIAERLGERTQLILICGHNEALATKLRALPHGAPRLVVGFTKEIPALMALADYFIGKPGPGSVSEAIRMGLPVIVEGNARTMPQERYNITWIREQGVGIVIPSLRKVGDAVTALLEDLEDFRARTRLIDNQALFEVPRILDGILGRRTG